MINFNKIKEVIILFLLFGTLTLAQDHKLGGKISLGLSPLALGAGVVYVYEISDAIYFRTLLEVDYALDTPKPSLMFRSVHLSSKSISVQLLSRPFCPENKLYFGAGVGYYLLSPSGERGHAPEYEQEQANVLSNDFSNTIGLDFLMGIETSETWSIEFNYKLLSSTVLLELSPFNGSRTNIKEEKIILHMFSINFIFAFSL